MNKYKRQAPPDVSQDYLPQEYKLVVARDWPELDGKINVALQEGWCVQGGICVTVTHSSAGKEIETFYQALVRDVQAGEVISD